MRQAIITKYHGPTNVRGSRVSAKAWAGRVILSWDHALNSQDNHIAAAKALADKLAWEGKWHGGGSPDLSGFAFVLEDSDGFEVGA